MTEQIYHQFDDSSFDADFSLQDLLQHIDTARLAKLLEAIIDGPYRLVNRKKTLICGSAIPIKQSINHPVLYDMEPVATLEVDQGHVERIEHANSLITLLLQNAAKYLMASRLHIQAINEDYRELQESEKKYRLLSEKLEVRVQEQVAEIQKNQQQLYQAEKMSSVGQLAAGVAHEINNPIGFVISNLRTAAKTVELLQSLQPLVKQAHSVDAIRDAWQKKDVDFLLEDFIDLLDDSLDGATRISDIVKNLKEYSNIDHHDEADVDLNSLIDNVCTLVSTQFAGKGSLLKDLLLLPKISCQPAYISQALMNVLLNAQQAIAADGLVSIATVCIDNVIEIKIGDNGCGMDEATCKKACDPFFTTRRVGEGTGLGLSVCHDIVRAHHGQLTVHSAVGEGTTVTIHLPLNVDKRAEKSVAGSADKSVHNNIYKDSATKPNE